MEHKEPPTEIFFGKDILAIQALKIIKDRNPRIPEDLAVIGLGNSKYASCTDQPLTSITFDKAMAGKIAAHKFLENKDNPDFIPTKTILPTKFVVRESCSAKLKKLNYKKSIL